MTHMSSVKTKNRSNALVFQAGARWISHPFSGTYHPHFPEAIGFPVGVSFDGVDLMLGIAVFIDSGCRIVLHSDCFAGCFDDGHRISIRSSNHCCTVTIVWLFHALVIAGHTSLVNRLILAPSCEINSHMKLAKQIVESISRSTVTEASGIEVTMRTIPKKEMVEVLKGFAPGNFVGVKKANSVTTLWFDFKTSDGVSKFLVKFNRSGFVKHNEYYEAIIHDMKSNTVLIDAKGTRPYDIAWVSPSDKKTIVQWAKEFNGEFIGDETKAVYDVTFKFNSEEEVNDATEKMMVYAKGKNIYLDVQKIKR